MDYLVGIFGILCVLSALIGGVIGGIVCGWLYAEYLSGTARELRAEVLSAHNTIKGARGNSQKEENLERMNNAMLEAGLMLKEGKDIKEVITTIGTKYPDIALKLANKFMKA